MARKDATTRKPDGAPSGASAMAEGALRAAQEAVASLKQQTDKAAPVPGASTGFTPGLPLASQAGLAPGTEAGAPPDPGAVDAAPGAEGARGIELLSDVNLNVKIELGRTRMLVEDVLRLSEGAVVELDKLAGDPVDVYVNDRPVARGEVLVLNDNFCVRISEIIAGPGDGEHGAAGAGADPRAG